jgi:hypothetical protein
LETNPLSLTTLIQRTPPPEDLSKILGPSGLKVLLELIRDAYFCLRDKRIITLSMNENEITEEWYVCLLPLWPQSSVYPRFVPIHEKQDNTSKISKQGKSPTIDFCFRSEWSNQSYFGAECKLIEADNKILCDRYISNGVRRYVDGIYSQNCSDGAMLGYVRETDCGAVANELHMRISFLEGKPQLVRIDLLTPFREYYVSTHNREQGLSPFTVHHFLFLFKHQA